MAFTNTTGRYASFGIVTSLPGNVIDSIWYIIDNYLKHVIPLKSIIQFQLTNNKGKMTVTFSQEHYQNALSVDLQIPFVPLYPSKLLVVDKQGSETILLPDELYM
ncbi:MULTISPECIES: DUF960 domain-containing protein [unclassified Streptococcus]|uniref:DUF960 domain-containing protein n=1 Tax=unclassified Streptococcus TaxID=2608887 RepID=UPI0010725430|nr:MULTISPECIES: DUF960 domain-containing protein [unclassified Streptococcus]MBF0787331.1 DUF960 domain-containing protein [Streptococcus sp. 19428wC2_LYSM12]MCQ9211130.1 DUF960 domain-containing protein [Streptococcus sp. B01]MCQ9214405.1 DUF960 domain-containing protein [Streptococcus sp. O1]TFV05679.1 hypothetical protein E4T79_05430 [Streptococcus sp. LYSM12]